MVEYKYMPSNVAIFNLDIFNLDIVFHHIKVDSSNSVALLAIILKRESHNTREWADEGTLGFLTVGIELGTSEEILEGADEGSDVGLQLPPQ